MTESENTPQRGIKQVLLEFFKTEGGEGLLVLKESHPVRSVGRLSSQVIAPSVLVLLSAHVAVHCRAFLLSDWTVTIRWFGYHEWHMKVYFASCLRVKAYS
jgi:hypothetical protein